MATTATSTDAVIADAHGPALRLTLNRPESLNGLSPEILDGLHAGMDRAEAEDDVRVLVIAGAGRAFCAGADLKHAQRLHELGGDAQQRFLRDIGATFDRLERLAAPTIGAVDGIACGGGLELLLVCDFVVATERARIGDAHANYGLLPGGGGSVRLPKRIGLSRAKRLMFSGDLLPAAELADTDLLTEVVADGDALDAAVDAHVASFADKSPLGLARMKQLAHDALESPTPVALRAELAMGAAHELSHDQREGLKAFHAKRTPVFEGR